LLKRQKVGLIVSLKKVWHLFFCSS